MNHKPVNQNLVSHDLFNLSLYFLNHNEATMENCKLCNETTDTLVKKVESSVIDMIKKHNPDWVESDGTCKKCVVYYENLHRMIEVDE